MKFDLGDCTEFATKDDCGTKLPGIKCVWALNRCVSFDQSLALLDSKVTKLNEYPTDCRSPGISPARTCSDFKSCSYCWNNWLGNCKWCLDKCDTECSVSQVKNKNNCCDLVENLNFSKCLFLSLRRMMNVLENRKIFAMKLILLASLAIAILNVDGSLEPSAAFMDDVSTQNVKSIIMGIREGKSGKSAFVILEP